MPDLSDEQEIFAATEGLKEEDTVVSPTPADEQDADAAAPEPEGHEGQEPDPDSGAPEGQDQPGQKKEPSRISYERFKEVNEDKKALRAELETMRTQAAEREQQLLRMLQEARQQPVQTPQAQDQPKSEEDILAALLANPGEFLKQQMTPYEQKIASLNDDLLAMNARSEHGAESFDGAKAWWEDLAQTNPQEAERVRQRVNATPNRYSELVREHQRTRLLNDIGPDPAAFEARLREKIIAELKGAPAGQQQVSQPPGQPQRQAPPSLVRAAGNAGISEQGAITEDDIFNSAPAFGKKRA